MTVSELRNMLTHLHGLLVTADAKPVMLRGLYEFIERTAEFDELTLNALLKLAAAGQRQPSTRPAPITSPGPRRSPSAIAAEVKDLFERAGDPSVTEEKCRDACELLGTLTKPALAELAESIAVHGMRNKTKTQISAAITNQLLDRKGAAIRRTLINRPDTNPSQSREGAEQPGVFGSLPDVR